MPGHVYVAPAGYHLLVERGGLALSTEAPVNHARPSLDVLFDSAAAAYGSEVIGVVLSGTGHDGAVGAVRLKRAGAVVLVQDPARPSSRKCHFRRRRHFPRRSCSLAICCA